MGSAADILRSPSFWIGSTLLAVILVAGYAMFLWARRWSAEMRSEAPTQLGIEHYRQLRDQGELSEQEFEKICALLERRSEQNPPPQ